MAKYKQNSDGFAVVIVILVVIVLAGILAFVTMNAMNKNKEENNNQSASTDNSVPSEVKQSKDQEELIAKSDTSTIAAEFPKALLPGIDFTVVESNTVTYNGKTTTVLELKIKGSMEDVNNATKAALTASGWTIDNEYNDAETGSYVISNPKDAKQAGSITWEPSANETGYIEWTSTIGLSGI